MNIRLGAEEDRRTILDHYPYTSQVMRDGGSLIIAERDGVIIGFLWSFRRKIPVNIGENEEFINVIEVFSDADRCKGTGSLLVQKCIEMAGDSDCYQIRAYCDINNIASHMLWVKNGFAISPVKNQDGSIPGSFVTYKL